MLARNDTPKRGLAGRGASSSSQRVPRHLCRGSFLFFGVGLHFGACSRRSMRLFLFFGACFWVRSQGTIRLMKTHALTTFGALASLFLFSTSLGLGQTAPKSPMEVASSYKTALSTLDFEVLKTLLTKREYKDEFGEDEREFLRAEKTKAPADVAEWEEELRDAKRDAAELSFLGEQIQGDRAIVTVREADEGEISYMLLTRKGPDAPWLIHDADEDDRKDVERFLQAPIASQPNPIAE